MRSGPTLLTIAVVACSSCSSASSGASDTDDVTASSNATSDTTTTSAGSATTSASGTGPTAGTGGSTGTGGSAGTTAGTGGFPDTWSTGCGTAFSPGDTSRTIDVDGMSREYILAVPSGYDPAQGMPLVFAWHGRGGDGALAKLYYGVQEAAAGSAIFVYPDGLPIAAQGGQTGWDLTSGGIDVAFFDAMANEVASELCIDLDRIFSTGHSFGAYMSNSLACYRGQFVRAIGGVAGGGPYGACNGNTAAWLAHGMSDGTVPYSEGLGSQSYYVGANGCSDQTMPIGDPAECVEHQGCDDGLPVVWCSHDEPALGGHGWPSWAGPAIWEFFTRF